MSSTSSTSDSSITAHGWAAQPRDPTTFLLGVPRAPPVAQTVNEIGLPDSALAKAVLTYAQQELPTQTFNHSMRVYYYGRAIQTQHFPSWTVTAETYLLACLLHDIGTTEKNLLATRLSFEFFGGMLALDLLHRQHNAPLTQAEGVAEAIIRHQDLETTTGNITTLGLLLQLGTLLDNTGAHVSLVHKDTIADVTKHYSRTGWSECFAGTIRRETTLKPWAHTTALGVEAFQAAVMGNEVMKEYE